MFTLQHINRRC